MPRNKIKKSLFTLLALSPFASMFLPGCSNSEIIVANFESYMSDELMVQTRNEFGCRFLYYDTNETIETKFEKNYDIAIPSSYEAMILKKKGLLEKIDWEQFEMKAEAKAGKVINVKTSEDAMFLFSDTTQNVLTAQDELYRGLGYLDNNEKVLDYCIPYFLQSWMFAYDGCEEIPALADENITWLDAAKEIGSNSYFSRGSTGVNIACVDDSRTVYGMSKLIYDKKNNIPQHDWNINPDTDGESIDQYSQVYSSFVSNFKSDSFYFNSDSQIILQSLADPKGANGAFCYNGDALYALTGGGISDFEHYWNSDNFHAVMPKETVITLDMLVFNKKNNDNEERMQKVYDIAKKLTLEGGSAGEDISKVDEEDNYVYGPMINFDFVMYTAPLKNVDTYVTEPDEGYIATEIDEDQQELFTKMYEIDANVTNLKNLFERPLSDLDKSNMHWAYEPEKEKL